METLKPQVLNGRYAIALGKPAESALKQRDIATVTFHDCCDAIVRSYGSDNLGFKAYANWKEETSSIPGVRVFRNSSWSSSNHFEIKLSDDGSGLVVHRIDPPF